MLLTERPEGLTAQRLSGLGCLVDLSADIPTAVATVCGDQIGYDLFVMDCDDLGGIPAAEQAIAALISASARMPVMLVSREFEAPAYPLGRRSAVCLPEVVSEAGFRFGFDHVLRDRILPVMM